ncbi:MAG: HNH endonuclease [Coriobacteriales bacterium]|jgi:hypothetical protein|nr:HNH endonuclease [Coriobacteriales bacterium]
MRPFAEKFYSSAAWRRTREAYAASRHRLCELCLSPADVVHHVRRLTPNNIHDASVTLSWDNLQLLCRRCHAEQHAPGGALACARAPVAFGADGGVCPPCGAGTFAHVAPALELKFYARRKKIRERGPG